MPIRGRGKPACKPLLCLIFAKVLRVPVAIQPDTCAEHDHHANAVSQPRQQLILRQHAPATENFRPVMVTTAHQRQ